MFSQNLYRSPTGQTITADGIILIALTTIYAVLALGPLLVVAAGLGKDWLFIRVDALKTKRSSWAFWILPIVVDLCCSTGAALALYVSIHPLFSFSFCLCISKSPSATPIKIE